VEKRLLTPYGLRLLAPENENYQTGGAKKIGTEEQTGPENQGSIWPYYLSFYFRARMNVAMGQGYNKYNRIKNELKNRINNLLYIAKTGALPEAFSGDAPYAPINNQGLSVYSISALIECLAFLNNDLPLKGYNVTAKRNVRLETLVKIFTSFK
jgi:glycogen debranching enzyme